MSDTWLDGPASETYLDRLEATNDGASADANAAEVAGVVARARQQLALRDAVALGFGGLVGVLFSLLARVVQHVHRRRHPNAATPER